MSAPLPRLNGDHIEVVPAENTALVHSDELKVPRAEVRAEKAEAEARYWRERAGKAEAIATATSNVHRNTNFTETERIRLTATLRVLHYEASNGNPHGYNKHNHGDVVKYAGILCAARDDTDKARAEAWENARKTAGGPLKLLNGLGLADSKQRREREIDPDTGESGIIASETWVKLTHDDLLTSLRALEHAGRPKVAKKSRGRNAPKNSDNCSDHSEHAEQQQCPKCGTTLPEVVKSPKERTLQGRNIPGFQNLETKNVSKPLGVGGGFQKLEDRGFQTKKAPIALSSAVRFDPISASQAGGTLEVMLAYAALGWHVLPVHSLVDGRCSCGKQNCGRVAKHPHTRRGLNDATTDAEVIRRWCKQWPTANIGIAVGPSGLVVMDPDAKGLEAWDALVERQGLPPTLTAFTGGGGKHVFYRAPDGVIIDNSRGVLPEGIDVRGMGGYVVVAPSMHASGKRYTWSTEICEVAPLPMALLKVLAPKPKKNGSRPSSKSSTFITTGHPIPDGQRNDTLFKVACAARGKGNDEEQILAILREANDQRCVTPLPDAELQKIAGSAASYAANQ